jgi:uncharacterized protein YcgI (DUF1989 family)
MKSAIVAEKIIPPESADAFVIKKGQFLRVIDIAGKQVADLVLFDEHDHSIKLSQQNTRRHFGAVAIPDCWEALRGITIGHQLLSTIETPMVTVVADTPIPKGIHDLLFRMCSRWVQTSAGFEPRNGCFENLTEALSKYGIKPGNISDPLNVFMNVQVDPANGMLLIHEPVSRPGDYLELKAEIDLLVGLTACAEHKVSKCNGIPPHEPKPIKYQIISRR